jgi:DNA topoisomerase-2
MTSKNSKKLSTKNGSSKADSDERSRRYKQMEFVDHLLSRPHNYGMNIDKYERSEWAWNGNKLELTKTDLPMMVTRSFIEIISNAADAIIDAKREGDKPGPIIVEVTKTRVTITNDHANLPVTTMKTREGINYVPEAVFGQVMTSGNYDDDDDNKREGSGQNGYGSKAVNGMSKKFGCIVIDHINNLKYEQVWTDHLQVHEPKITKIKGAKYGEVTIFYDLDLSLAGMNRYTQFEFDIFYRNCIDMSFCSQNTVIYNGEKVMVKSAAEYLNLYFGSEGNEKIEFIDDTFEGDGYKLRVLIADRESDRGDIISFVNCLNVPNHGAHVDAVYKAICEPIRDIFNKGLPEGATKLTIREVKKHLNMIVIANIESPIFEGPAKQQLRSPIIKLQLDSERLKKYESIVKWKCMNQLKELSNALRRKKEFGKLKGKTGRHLDFGKAKKNITPANWAGGPRRKEAVLIIVEGESAACYCGPFIALQPGGRDKYGVLQLQGKILNVASFYDNNPERIAESAIIKLLMMALGLNPELDYSIEKNRDKLNYGEVMIMTDADHDGLHIKGLIDNFFHVMFPALLSPDFISYYRVPIIKAYKGREVRRFYTTYEFDEFRLKELKGKKEVNVNGKRTIGGWKFRYFKGLATSNDKDVREDATNPMIIRYQVDDESREWIEKIFRKSSVEERKKWVRKYQKKSKHPFVLREDDVLSNFFKNEFIFYILTSLTRAIIHRVDGLKESQRKILWTSFSLKSEHKVFQFGGNVAKKTEYEHGDMSLHKAITAMARTYAGSNNMEYLTPIGQFGNREDPKHGSPRYISVNRAWWLDLVFHQDDMNILTFTNPEPDFLLPIIPMQLVNGTKGVANTWSSYIPAYNPLDIIAWLIQRLECNMGAELEEGIELKPWYRYHTGEIEVNERENDECESLIHKSRYYLYEYDEESGELIEMEELEPGKGIVAITELPIPSIPVRYENKILDDRLKNGIITDYTHHMAGDEAFFIAYNPKNLSDLNLTITHSLTNMYQLDESGRAIQSFNVYHLIEEFFNLRLPFYQIRKDNVIARIEEKMIEMRHKYNFIKLVCDGELIVVNRPRKVIITEMEVHGVPASIYSKRLQYDEEELTEIKTELEKLEAELELYRKMKVEELWIQDLKVLREALQKRYVMEHLEFYYSRMSRYLNKLREINALKKLDIDQLVLKDVMPQEIKLTKNLIKNVHQLEKKWRVEWNETSQFNKERVAMLNDMIHNERNDKKKRNNEYIKLLESDPILTRKK